MYQVLQAWKTVEPRAELESSDLLLNVSDHSDTLNLQCDSL